MNGSQSQVGTWVEGEPGPAVLAALATRVQAAHGRVVEQSTDRLTARFGSRMAYRLFGALLAPGSTHAPMRVTFDLKPAGSSTTVTATAFSDTGWYLTDRHLPVDRTLRRQAAGAARRAGPIRHVSGCGDQPVTSAD